MRTQKETDYKLMQDKYGIYAEKVVNGHWINCKDLLPKFREQCLVFSLGYDNTFPIFGLAHYNATLKCWCADVPCSEADCQLEMNPICWQIPLEPTDL